MAMPPGFFSVQLHRLILNALPGQFVEFIDSDSLNCRRSNLRIAASRAEIRRCHRPGPNESSRCRGVCFDKSNGFFRAYLMHKGKRHFLGFFETDVEGAIAYNQKSRELLGDRGFQNEIP